MFNKIKKVGSAVKEGVQTGKALNTLRNNANVTFFEGSDGNVSVTVNGRGTAVQISYPEGARPDPESVLAAFNAAAVNQEKWLQVQVMPFVKNLPPRAKDTLAFLFGSRSTTKPGDAADPVADATADSE